MSNNRKDETGLAGNTRSRGRPKKVTSTREGEGEEKKEEEEVERPCHLIKASQSRTKCSVCFSSYVVVGEEGGGGDGGDWQKYARGYRNYDKVYFCCEKAFCIFHMNEHLGFSNEDKTPLFPSNKTIYSR